MKHIQSISINIDKFSHRLVMRNTKYDEIYIAKNNEKDGFNSFILLSFESI